MASSGSFATYQTTFPSVTKILLWSPMSSRCLFSRPCGQLSGLCPTCLFHSLRHGCLGLNEVFPFLSFFYSPRSITIVLPFGHQGLSLLSIRVFPLVIKVPHLHLHSFEVKCDERRTKNERTDRTESRTMSVISIDEQQSC